MAATICDSSTTRTFRCKDPKPSKSKISETGFGISRSFAKALGFVVENNIDAWRQFTVTHSVGSIFLPRVRSVRTPQFVPRTVQEEREETIRSHHSQGASVENPHRNQSTVKYLKDLLQTIATVNQSSFQLTKTRRPNNEVSLQGVKPSSGSYRRTDCHCYHGRGAWRRICCIQWLLSATTVPARAADAARAAAAMV